MNGERLCGYYLGARLTDVTNLTWENVDLGKSDNTSADGTYFRADVGK